MIVDFIKKIFLLDGRRYKGDASYFRRMAFVDPDGTYDDGIIRVSVSKIPKRIIPAYKFYINFNKKYFMDLFYRVYLLTIVCLPFVTRENFLYLFIPGLAYSLLCIILNSVITVIELRKIKKEMLEIYHDLLIQYEME